MQNEINSYPVVAVFNALQNKYISYYPKIYESAKGRWDIAYPYVYYLGLWYAIGGAGRLKKALYTADGKYLRTADGRIMLLDDIM